MKRDQQLFITDIYDSIILIEKYLGKLFFEEFSQNSALLDAVVMRFAIIGEAAKNVSRNFKAEHKDIPWKYMCGFRDVIVHEYFGINAKKTWQTAKEDLPRLKSQIKTILDEMGKDKLFK
jgi:uncharacterized protein with HEPN domain